MAEADGLQSLGLEMSQIANWSTQVRDKRRDVACAGAGTAIVPSGSRG
jgi:hypothetical protein